MADADPDRPPESPAHGLELRCAPVGWPESRIRIGAGIADDTAALARHCAAAGVRAILADAGALAERPALLPVEMPARVLAGGEACKTFAELERALDAFGRLGLTRDATLLVLGGGAVGDLGGLAAALWMRGIAHVQVPTTLLAMVDSSVGGKTAIDSPHGKNLVGAFWPARDVLIDPTFVRTLPDAEIRSGLGEVLKTAIGLDTELFAALEARIADSPAKTAPPDALDPRADVDWAAYLVERCVRAKIAVVERDPTEAGDRRLLNLGHTIGHAIEAASGYRRPHGLCVARGLHTATRLATGLGHLAAPDAERIHALLRACGFDEDPLPAWSALEAHVRRDKKATADGAVREVVPTGIGRSRVIEVDVATLRESMG